MTPEEKKVLIEQSNKYGYQGDINSMNVMNRTASSSTEQQPNTDWSQVTGGQEQYNRSTQEANKYAQMLGQIEGQKTTMAKQQPIKPLDTTTVQQANQQIFAQNGTMAGTLIGSSSNVINQLNDLHGLLQNLKIIQ
jgi:hypothetical protein